MRRGYIIGGICLACWIALCLGCTKQTSWDIRVYGAVGDGSTVNTLAIQQAIDACAAAGGGEVVIPQGVFVSGTIILKDRVTLRLSEGATLQSSINPNDFEPIDPFIDATGQYRGQCLIGAMNAKEIGIVGSGKIDGRGEMFTPKQLTQTLKKLGIEANIPVLPKVDTATQNYVNKNIRVSSRPFLIRLVGCSDILVKDVELRQAAAWTLHFYQCERFYVKGIHILSHANRNNDGIDIDSSVDGYISHCNIDSGDDAVCFKTTSPQPTARILVEDCTLKSDWGAIKFGTESMGDFRDITIRDCFIHDTKGGGIKILSVDGAHIRNIRIDRIRMEQVDMPLFVRLGERRLVYRDAERMPVGSIDSVYISHVTAIARSQEQSRLDPPTGIFITGTPAHPIQQLFLQNIDITLPGGGEKVLQHIAVPEQQTQYPEFTQFGGPLPAYGLFARHIDSLQLEQVEFNLLAPDMRPERIIY